MSAGKSLLVINGGSSSIRFAFYDTSPVINLLLRGKLENIGSKTSNPVITTNDFKESQTIKVRKSTYAHAVQFLID